jgi:hypothetical protein
MALTGYHELAANLQSDLVNHGWGELVFRVTSLKDGKAKIEILCGKSYVFIVKKEIRFEDKEFF